jgi:penicillin V acylase-like amidase (Ntn superfamily)
MTKEPAYDIKLGKLKKYKLFGGKMQMPGDAVDITNKIYYFNSTTAPNIAWVDFKNFNFDKGAKQLMIDPTDVELIGEVSGKFK